MKVCVVVPAYNESIVINGVISKAKKLFLNSPHKITILVVDDGSSDNTAPKASKGGAVVISHILNMGVGGATATGVAYAKKENFDLVATMDADGQHDPMDLLKGIDLMSQTNTDLLIGSRLINKAGMSRIKVIGNKGLGLITYLLFGVSSTDSQSGLRLLSRRAVEKLKWETLGYEFCSEMLWRAKQQKLQIREYPIKAIYTQYSRSKGQSNWNAINIVKTLLKRRLSELFQ